MAAVLAVVVAAVGLGAAAAETAEARTNVTVMLRNLYLGTDPIRLALQPTQEAFRQEATRLWRQLKRTDFPGRANLIANEIAASTPDLIALNEVALWRRSAPGQSDDDATPATRVRFDFLKILQHALRHRGQHYRLVAAQREADLEGPTSKDFDVRLTMHDTILARRGANLRVTATRGDNYSQNLGAPTAYGREELTRGWVAADLRRGGARFRFVNTHLEAYSGGIGALQAEELAERRGALATGKQTILIGDLNSDPKGAADQATAYRTFRRDGFRDAWLSTHGDQPGFTFGFDSNVKGSPSDFNQRIDHILFRNGPRVRSMRRVGLDPDNRLPRGRWPSDHAGLVARFSVRDHR